MTGLVAPSLPHNKDYHVYTSNTADLDDCVVNLLNKLQQHGFKCVYKNQNFRLGWSEVCNIDYYVRKCWKFLIIVTPEYIECADMGEKSSDFGTPLILESSIILETKSNDRDNVVCLVVKDCDLPPVMTIYTKIDIKHNPHWFESLLKALGARKAVPDDRESSFRYCSMCDTDFTQDFRVFQCSNCKQIGCLGCVSYYTWVTSNSMTTGRVCFKCFDIEKTKKRPKIFEDEDEYEDMDLISDPNASKFGFFVLYHFPIRGCYRQMNSTKSTAKYCDMCKRKSAFGIKLDQCSLCSEIACIEKCVKFYAPVTRQQLRMGPVCRHCFRSRASLPSRI